MSQSVPVGDDKGINDSFLRYVKEASETSTLHVQARADIGED